jgi:hypothetical protein
MTADEYLASKNWRRLNPKANKMQPHYWDHPDHQPNLHGAFTTRDAVEAPKASGQRQEV